MEQPEVQGGGGGEAAAAIDKECALRADSQPGKRVFLEGSTERKFDIDSLYMGGQHRKLSCSHPRAFLLSTKLRTIFGDVYCSQLRRCYQFQVGEVRNDAQHPSVCSQASGCSI